MQFSVRASLEQFTLPHPGGEGQFKISVAAPAMVLPDARVPVLYVADGDLLFGLAAEIARAMMNVGVLPPFYVVGLGYDADDRKSVGSGTRVSVLVDSGGSGFFKKNTS